MSSVDDRVVQMKFDNSQFQQGVAETNKSLESLKNGLNLGGAAKSLDGLNAAGSRFSLAGIQTGVEQLSTKFSNMGIVAITAITNITNRAIDAGINIGKALTIDPIKTGLEEYETNLKSVQTILANTQVSGATLDDVNGALEELNHYSDQTIYNFAEMAKNIGTFTAAGVDLETSTASIKGIANLAALSGSSSQDASRAMYQLSQEIAGGKVTLMGWNSVVTAGMGGSTFQRALAETAVAMGKIDGNTLKLEGKMKNVTIAGQSFRDSISAETGSGWLTSDVLTATLEQFTGDMTVAELKAMKFSDTQITAIQKMAATAKASATEVKTLSGVFDTAKEVAGSGWAKTWQLIMGDFKEAKTLFTGMSGAVNGVLEKMNSARNEALAEWKLAGGRNDVIKTFQSAWSSVGKVLSAVGRAFREIFPPVTGKNLKDITAAFLSFVKGLTPTTVTLINIQRVAKGVFAALDIGRMIIVGVVKVIRRLVDEFAGGGPGILDFAAKIGDMLVKFRESVKAGNHINDFFRKFHEILSVVIASVKNAGKWIGDLFGNFEGVDTSGAVNALDGVKKAVKPLEASGEHLRTIWEKLGDVFRGFFEFIRPLGEKIGEWIRGIGDNVSKSVGNMDWNLVLDGINTGLFAGLVLLIRKFMAGGFGGGDDDDMGIMDRIKEAFGGMTDTLGEMQNTLKAGTLLTIAAAIALLAGSAVTLASVDSGKLTQVLGAMAVMMGQLMVAMAVFDRINPISSIGSLVGMGLAMILLATAIRILAESVEELGSMDWQTLIKGLVGVTVLLGAIAVAARIMSTQNKNMIATGIGLIAVAFGIKILASAVGDFAEMDWQKMMQGLIGVGMVLGGLALFTQLAKVNKGAIGMGVGLILLGVAIKVLASGVGDFAAMDWQKMMQGLIAMGMVIGGLAIFSRIVNPAQMVSMGVSLVIISASMKIFASAISDLGNIDWQKMMQGLIAMGMMLGGLAIFSRVINPAQMVSMGVSLVIIAVALKMLTEAVMDLGNMDWQKMMQGLMAMGLMLGGLALFSIIVNPVMMVAMGASLVLIATALTMLVPVLQQLGGMSWETIGTGLGALAAALGLLAVSGLVLGVLSPLFAAFGIALLILGAGAALAGIGVLAFSIGITALAVAGAAGAASLSAIVLGLAAMLPQIMIMVGAALVAFAQVIITSAPAFGAAIMAVLNTLLNIIIQISPKIISTLWRLVTMMVEALVRGIPYLVNAGMRLLIGILTGIANNIGRIVTTVANIIVNFLNALANNLPRIIAAGTNLLVRFIDGIRNAIPRLLQAGADLVIDFVEGLATTIRNNTDRMNTAGRNLAGAIIDGMTGGIAGGLQSVIDSAVNLGKGALDAAKNILGIKSPSREFKKVGAYSSEGFALGITSLTGMVAKSASGVGTTALDALSSSISNMSSLVSSEMDMNPTIRPVLDLTDIKNDSDLIGGMLDKHSLSLNGAYAKATLLSNATMANQAVSQERSEALSGGGPSLQFTQINNSPKALSRSEIYRSTNNQLSVAKGALAKK